MPTTSSKLVEYDKYPIKDVLGLRSKFDCKHDSVGIELEAEFPPSEEPRMVGTDTWYTVGENSLRNGCEYLSRKPVYIEDIPKHCAELFIGLGASRKKLRKSIRTSTHVHVNVMHKTAKEILGAVAFYALVEGLLFNKVPKERRGNLFCLRMSDAEYIWHDLHHTILGALEGSERFFRNFDQDRHKYGALNFASIRRIGTLEFRFLEAHLNEKDLTMWVDLIQRMVYTGAKLSVREHLELYDRMSVVQYLIKILGEDHTRFLTEGLSTTDINNLMHMNYDYVHDMAFFLDRPILFQMPRNMWDEDLAPEDGDREPPRRTMFKSINQGPIPGDVWFEEALQAFPPGFSNEQPAESDNFN